MKKLASVLVALALLAPLALSAAEGAQSLINVNSATVEQLVTLPGIGPSKAQAIVAYREQHPFKAVSELTEVRGIGPKLLEKIQTQVTVDGSVVVPSQH